MRLSFRAVVRVIAALFLISMVLFPRLNPSAHEEEALSALTVLDRVTPELPDVEIVITHPSIPTITVRNRSDRPLVVEGVQGEDFLRIGAVVELNVFSRTSYQSLDPSGQRPLPPGLDTKKDARWVVVARSSNWSWLDPRLEFLPGQTFNSTWAIPARLGRTPVSIEGGFEPLDAHGHFSTAIDITDHPDDLDIQFLFGPVPGIYVRNDTNQVLRVPGLENEPFLEIGPRGVFANMKSPTYHFGGTQTVRRVPESADPSAAPRWERVSKKPIWAWLELRARVSPQSQYRSELGDERRTVLNWTTPMWLGKQYIELTGDLDWIPPEAAAGDSESGDGGINPLWVAAIAAGAGVGAIAVQRRRAGELPLARPSAAGRARQQQNARKSGSPKGGRATSRRS